MKVYIRSEIYPETIYNSIIYIYVPDISCKDDFKKRVKSRGYTWGGGVGSRSVVSRTPIHVWNNCTCMNKEIIFQSDFVYQETTCNLLTTYLEMIVCVNFATLLYLYSLYV